MEVEELTDMVFSNFQVFFVSKKGTKKARKRALKSSPESGHKNRGSFF